MKNQRVWDVYMGEQVEMPKEMQAFLTDIETVCRRYGLSLAHEDEQGGFLVEELKERNLRWVAGAAKRYIRMKHPGGGHHAMKLIEKEELNVDSTSAKRFVKALRYTEEVLDGDAK